MRCSNRWRIPFLSRRSGDSNISTGGSSWALGSQLSATGSTSSSSEPVSTASPRAPDSHEKWVCLGTTWRKNLLICGSLSSTYWGPKSASISFDFFLTKLLWQNRTTRTSFYINLTFALASKAPLLYLLYCCHLKPLLILLIHTQL